jgi:hypothetical protein
LVAMRLIRRCLWWPAEGDVAGRRCWYVFTGERRGFVSRNTGYMICLRQLANLLPLRPWSLEQRLHPVIVTCFLIFTEQIYLTFLLM